jgi:hypothetical protein
MGDEVCISTTYAIKLLVQDSENRAGTHAKLLHGLGRRVG